MMYKYEEITEKIIGCAFRVYNNLGFGFLEKIYKKAMIIELKKEGFNVVEESKIEVHYEGEILGEYYADLLVENKVIVELKSIKDFNLEFPAACGVGYSLKHTKSNLLTILKPLIWR